MINSDAVSDLPLEESDEYLFNCGNETIPNQKTRKKSNETSNKRDIINEEIKNQYELNNNEDIDNFTQVEMIMNNHSFIKIIPKKKL
ncbi:hypothetical protein [Methanobrevibacter boviskoreani]|uniref:hypothetical protein n=1 Tax=Methanobrevibacter boviskoreani TaxID=1348249 RepID=UPI0005953A92|nr:hypothetical protein [Methanobrevibacter boviskoreani]MCI6774397.1 hypothetical protein [Methanobrevibacter boviskoreani]MDY5613877.1 hypothetical protein [Methanobrevibacter boviskoreani]